MISKITIHFVWLLKSGLKWTLTIKSLRKRYEICGLKKLLILSNIFFVSLLQITQKNPLWKRELFLSIPCSFYHSYPIACKNNTWSNVTLEKKFFHLCRNIHYKYILQNLHEWPRYTFSQSPSLAVHQIAITISQIPLQIYGQEYILHTLLYIIAGSGRIRSIFSEVTM